MRRGGGRRWFTPEALCFRHERQSWAWRTSWLCSRIARRLLETGVGRKAPFKGGTASFFAVRVIFLLDGDVFAPFGGMVQPEF